MDEEDIAKFTDVVKEFDSMTPLVYILPPLHALLKFVFKYLLATSNPANCLGCSSSGVTQKIFRYC